MRDTRTQLTKEERDGIIARMKEFHLEVMKKNSTKKIYFFPKVPYPNGNGIKVIGLFRSELERPDEDMFIELINMGYEPLDDKRTLYRHRFNPHFREEYENANGHSERYHVPVHELEVVWKIPAAQSGTPVVNEQDSLEDKDNNISQLTIRDLASLLLRKPVSSKAWLNDLIKTVAG